MLGFMRRRRAIAVLQNEMCLERSAISDGLLEVFLGVDGNEYDAAINYVIARARAVDFYDQASEAMIISELILAKSCVHQARGDQDRLLGLIDDALACRRNREAEIFVSFDSWLRTFKEVCGDVNPMMAVDEDGRSIVDFFDQEGFKRAFSDRYSPVLLAREFAPTFYPDTFGR